MFSACVTTCRLVETLVQRYYPLALSTVPMCRHKYLALFLLVQLPLSSRLSARAVCCWCSSVTQPSVIECVVCDLQCESSFCCSSFLSSCNCCMSCHSYSLVLLRPDRSLSSLSLLRFFLGSFANCLAFIRTSSDCIVVLVF